MPNLIFQNTSGPYAPLPSLAQQKSASLASAYSEKKLRQEPPPVQVGPTPEQVAAANLSLAAPAGDSLANFAGSGLLQGFGRASDYIAQKSNDTFGTSFNTTEQDGFSNPTVANEAAGLSQEAVNQFGADQQQFFNSVADSHYGDAFKQGLALAPRVAASSSVSLVELGVGAALTPLLGAGAGLLAKKAKDIGNTVASVKKAFDASQKLRNAKKEAEKLKKVTRLSKASRSVKDFAKNLPKVASQTSILNMDMVQQQINDYRAQNNGEYPSAQREAVMGLTSFATNMFEPLMVANLLVPNFKKEIVKEGVNLIKNLGDGSALFNIVKRAGEGILKLSAAGAAEAGQEYVQAWQQMLVSSITPEETNNLMAVLTEKLSNQANRDSALGQGILGGFAGGATKGAISAPAIAAGTAVDLAKATAKGTTKTAVGATKIAANIVKDQSNKAALKILNPEERARLRSTYESEKEVNDQIVAKFDDKVKTVREAKSFDELLANKEIAKDIEAARQSENFSQEQAQDPKNFKKIQNNLQKKYKADIVVITGKLEASRLGRLGKKLVEKGKDAIVDTATKIADSVPDETVRKAIVATLTAQKVAKETITAVKDIQSSAALGVVELALREGTKASKEITDRVKNLEISDATRAVAAIKEKYPDLGRHLERAVEHKNKVLRGLEQRNDNLITEETLPPVVKDVVARGNVKEKNGAYVAQIINKVLAGKIGDKATLATVRQALEVYKSSDAFKAQGKGTLNAGDISLFEKRLVTAEKRLNREVTGENIINAVEAVTESVDSAVSTAADKVKAVKEAAQPIIDKGVKVAEDLADHIDKKIDEFGNKKKVIAEDKYKELVGKVISLTGKGKPGTDEAIRSLPGFMNLLTSLGYKTEDDFKDLVDQFPGLAENEEFFNALQEQFVTDVLMEDSVLEKTTPVEAVDPSTLSKLKDQLDKRCKL